MTYTDTVSFTHTLWHDDAFRPSTPVRTRVVYVERATGRDDFSEFHNALKHWRRDVAFSSVVRDKIQHPAFRQIVRMKERAIPWIIKEIRHTPDFLVMALPEITKEDPVPPHARGNLNEIINAWLDWASRNRTARNLADVL